MFFLTTEHQYCWQNNCNIIPFLRQNSNIAGKTLAFSFFSYNKTVIYLAKQQFCHSFLTTEQYYCWQNNSNVIPFLRQNSNIASKTTVLSVLSYNRTVLLLARQQYCHSFLTTEQYYCWQNNSFVIPFFQQNSFIAVKITVMSFLFFLQQNSNIAGKTTVLSFLFMTEQ